METGIYYIPLKKHVEHIWPVDVLALPDTSRFKIWMALAQGQFNLDDGEIEFETSLLFEEALSIEFPFINICINFIFNLLWSFLITIDYYFMNIVHLNRFPF